MPFEWNNSIVVTKDELVPQFFKSWDILRQTILRYEKKSYGIKRVQLGGNGRQMLISFDSLPIVIQEGLGDPRKCDHILERYYKVDGDAVNFYSTYKFTDGTYLDIEYQEKYIVNASLLKSVIRLREARESERRSKGGSLVGISATLCADAVSFQKTLKAKHGVQHTLPENERRFKEALKRFETEGYTSLISAYHKNNNSRKVTDETLKLLNDMFAGRNHKPTATDVHREYDAFISGYITVINNETGECYAPASFKKLSTTTVTNYMAQWANRIGTHGKRSGDRQKYMQLYKPHHSTERPKFAGSIISIDDRQPPFKALDGKRIWFYNGIDLASEAFTCCVYGETKDGIILEFYRQLVRNYAAWGFNLPAELEAELSLNASYKDTFLREGSMFQHVRIEANNARGKKIERYFRALRYGAEKEREGWLARPFAGSESNQAGPKEAPSVPYREIVENSLRDIENWNNQPHSIHTHMSRWEVFTEMQNPELKPTNYISFLPHIGFKTSTSCNVASIRFQYKEYLLGHDGKVALGENLISLMKQVEGQEIDIYWLDDHEGRVFKALIFKGSQYICEAVAKPTYNRAKAEQGADDKRNYEIMSSYVATIEAFARRQKRSIDTVTIIDNRPAPKKTFVMPGLAQRTVEDWKEPEILGNITTEDTENIPAQSFVRSLKDRF